MATNVGATNARDTQLDADLAALGRANKRKALVLAGLIGLLGAISAVGSAANALSGDGVAIGQGILGIVGVAAAILLMVRPRQGWLLAMVWALIQVPFFAWTPAGSPTTQILSLPVTMSQSSTVNGVMTAYSAIGINVVGLIFAAWLRAWRGRFQG